MSRALDLAISAVALVLLSPLMALAALWVNFDSRGPVLFRQLRVGRGGVPFEIYKFRTMRAGDGPLITVVDDPRITRSGRFLRRTKIDELPQLFNVLDGTMSLVGPRPEVPRYVDLWPSAERAAVLSVRPGITDPGSVTFARESELLAEADDPERYYIEEILPRKVAIYADYVAHRTLGQDLRILIRTVAVLLGRGKQ